MSIDINVTVKKKKIPGWYGKGKGLMQILRETGFIDISKLSEYRVERRDEETGNIIEEFSLQRIMASRADFANEVSQLEFIGKKLGCNVIIAAKNESAFD